MGPAQARDKEGPRYTSKAHTAALCLLRVRTWEKHHQKILHISAPTLLNCLERQHSNSEDRFIAPVTSAVQKDVGDPVVGATAQAAGASRSRGS